MNFLRTCWADEERTDQFAASTLGLIGDFGDTYKAAVRDEIMQDWVQSAIAYGRQRGASKQARTNAAYAQRVCTLMIYCGLISPCLRLSENSRNDPSGKLVTFPRQSQLFFNCPHICLFSLLLDLTQFRITTPHCIISTISRPRSVVQGRSPSPRNNTAF